MKSHIDLPMIVRAASAGGFIRVNKAFGEAVGFRAGELAEKPFLSWIAADDHDEVRALLDKTQDCCRARHRTCSGDFLWLEIRLADHEEGPILLGRCPADPAIPPEIEDGLGEDTFSSTLETIAHIVEEQNPDYKCSILLVDEGRFVSGAGPSLPDDYNAAIDGYAVGPTVGSCGTAIYWNVPVIAVDIQADPLWAPFAELARNAGVAACWSHPFTSTGGGVLGALALYAPEPRAPTDEQLGRLRAAARMTGLAVERGRAEQALREKRKRELELEDQLRQAAKMEALGVLAGGVAHDFNNVLSTILANAEFALELAPSDPEIPEMLEAVISASQRAGHFCTQMLAYAGRGTLRTSRIELGALLSELSDLAGAALSKKATLEYILHSEPIFVDGDENQLLQVVLNLVTNAAEALGHDEGRIVVRTTLEHCDTDSLSHLSARSDMPAGQYVRLTVSDTGCGMDAQTAARIFDPFFTTKFTGRGLGLAAVKGIVLKHDGLIHTESQVGEGTTFTILLPTVTDTEQCESVPAKVATSNSPKRVLVVDDEDALRAIFCKRLQHCGFDVIEAADGQEAIETFRENADSIDCVLLDLSMPRLSGEEVYEQLHALQKDLPIVVMSGFTEEEILVRFTGTEIAGALQKPIRAADLVASLRRATT